MIWARDASNNLVGVLYTELQIELTRIGEKHRNITRWLMQPDPNTTRTKVAKSRTPGSGVWFTDGMAFNAWLESPSSSVLWLNGITGAGKTTLIRTTALDHLLSSHKAWGCVAYFYSAFSDSATLEASNILCSIIGQLCKPTDRVYSRIEAAFDAKLQSNFVQPSRLSTDDVLSLLIEHIQDIGKAYIFLDAINECGDPLEIVDYLRQILVSCPESAVHVFVSSINEKGIEDHIKQLPCLNVVTLSPLDISLDIELLVLSSIEANPRLRKHNSEVKHEIAHTLTRGAQGMFRWVQCQLDRLSKLRTPGAIHGALETLPPTLDKTYEDMLCRIEPEDKELAHDILELLSFSLEPLNLNQVCEYLQVVPGMDILDESKKLTDPKDILSVCGSLLNYQSDTEIVTLAHHSVYTYLESNLQGKVSYYKLSEVEADRSLALKCLTYLSTQTFAYRPDAKDFSLRQHSKDHPFLSYAAQKWPLHTQKLTDLGEPLWATLKSFLFSKDLRRGNFLSWVQMLIPKSGNIQSTPPLYYAASYGLLPVVRYLLQAGAPTEVYGGWGSATPINIAAYRGYADVVKLLLDHGADPVALDGHGMGTSAIGWARAFRHTAVLEVFAAAGYKVPGLAPRPNGAPARGPQYSLSPVPGS
ncbi:hypothetical protein MMC13_002535 [Lambiella insularis]|nr:hypothetical protein [Lambiella insularis]